MSSNSGAAKVGSSQGETGHELPGILFASLKFFYRMLHWLADLIHLTEEEQRDAGIYLGYEQDK